MKMVRKMTMTSPLRGLFLLALFWLGGGSSVHAERLTSTSCPSLRWAAFPARLDLYYFYLIEFDESEKTAPDLDGIARAIATAILDSFQGCNAFGEPVHAVQLVDQAHRYSNGGADTGVCGALTPNHACRVVRGVTSILLDTSADGVPEQAYGVMRSVLANTTALDDFLSTPVAHAEFIRRIGENLVVEAPPGNDRKDESPDDDKGLGKVPKLAIISGSVSFFLTTLAILVLTRKHQNTVEEKAKMRLAYYNAKRRKFWSQLDENEDEQTYPGLMMVNQPAPMPTVTWSVSDLTSESNSIKSVLKMDCIEEEHEEGSRESQDRDVEQLMGEDEPSFDDLYEEGVREDHEPSPALPRPSLEVAPFAVDWHDDHSELATRGSTYLMADRVWELASLPRSYWDESDPEASTPNASPAKFGSPMGGAYLQDSGDESFADNELNFSVDSPNKVPVVTYTTEEEEASEATSTSPAATVRHFDRSPDDSSSDLNSAPAPVSPNHVEADEECDAMSQKKEGAVTETVVSTASASSSESPAATTPPKVDSPTVASSTSLDLASKASDEHTNDNGSLSPTPDKNDVFYTPPQPQRTETLALVAKTIVNQVDIYDEATRRWAQRVLEVMSSPTPKLLAAEPHHPS